MASATQTVPPNRVPLAALLTANAISLTGNSLAGLALPWFVLQTTGSAGSTGLTAFFGALPLVISALLGGAVADHIGHKRTSVLADLLSGAATALVPLLFLFDLLPFWLLLALVFVGALLDMPGAAARQGLLPGIAAQANARLEQVNAARSTIQRASMFAGPLLAGVLVSIGGANNVLWLNAASFFVSAGLIGWGVPVQTASKPAPVDRTSYLADVREGLQFILQNPLLRVIAFTAMLSNFLLDPLFAIILPVYVNQVYGEATWLGFLVAAFGSGSVIGAVGYGTIGHRLSRRTLFIAGFAGTGLGVAVLPFLPPLWVMLAASFFVGIIGGPLNPLIDTLLQERTPPHLLARVFGSVVALAMMAMPLSLLTTGYLLEFVGVQTSLALIAVGSLVVGASLFFAPSLRDMNVPDEHTDRIHA